jgi:hypothetical protein
MISLHNESSCHHILDPPCLPPLAHVAKHPFLHISLSVSPLLSITMNLQNLGNTPSSKGANSSTLSVSQLILGPIMLQVPNQ